MNLSADSILLVAIPLTLAPVDAQEILPFLYGIEAGEKLHARLRNPFGKARMLEARTRELRVAGGVMDFSSDRAFASFGPDRALAVAEGSSFTVEIEARMRPVPFCTALMCRDGNSVFYSIVVGRTPGTISFELWDWRTTRLVSTTRVDDGQWHRVQATYDGASQTSVLIVDGRVEAVRQTTGVPSAGAAPILWLGCNHGGSQPLPGQLRNVRVLRGIPASIDEFLRLRSTMRLLDPVEVAGGFERWLVRHRKPRRPAARTLREWRDEARSLRAGIQDALGLWPPPYSSREPKRRAGARSALSGGSPEVTNFAEYQPELPLEVRRGGELRREGYTVTRVYWQTFQGYSASGYLYRPTGSARSRSRPAVLCPHGHWQRGASSRVVQTRCITLARSGYVALAVDAVHVDDDPIGLSSLSVMTWNNLRALELLRSMADVDAERIGCTGGSGGGLQTIYLTALESGLAAAAPAVIVSDFESMLRSWAVPCRCNFTPRVMGFADQPLISAAFAPRRQLFLSVSGDWTRDFPTRGFPGVRRVYGLLDATDRVESRLWPGPHRFDRDMRNAVYTFFEQSLRGSEDPDSELEPESLEPEPWTALQALDRRDVPRDLEAVSREFRARLAVPSLTPAQMEGEGADQVVAERRRLLSRLLASPPRSAPPGVSELETVTWRQREGRCLLIRSEPEILLPAVVFRPEDSETLVGLAVLVHPSGKAHAIGQRGDWVEGLLARGYAVALADVRYTGELDVARTWREPYGKILGRDEAMLAAHDIRRLVDARDAIAGGEIRKVAVFAFGSHGVAGLLAAAVDERIDAVAAPELGATYRERDRRPKLCRILRHGDLPDAACLVAPRALLLGSCNRMADYRAARSRFASRKAGHRLAARSEPVRSGVAMEWLDRL